MDVLIVLLDEGVQAGMEDLGVEITAVRIARWMLGGVREIVEMMGVRFKVREYIPCIR